MVYMPVFERARNVAARPVTAQAALRPHEAQFEIAILLKTRFHQLADEWPGLRSGGCSDEGLIG